MKVINVVGARPNFMKIAPVLAEMKKFPDCFTPLLVHTGQHYDENMSQAFFKDLELPEPDIYLGVGSGTHSEQTAKIMVEFEKIILKEHPDLVVVVGDVNSTLACAIVAAKLYIPVAHIEAGLRSFDRRMPEEINRLLTDALSDYLFITEKDAEENLLKEGRSKERIFFVGNVMIDTLLKNKSKADSSPILSRLGLEPKKYALLTLHRPENVDDKDKLQNILSALEEVAKYIRIVFPIHPRTRKSIASINTQYSIPSTQYPILNTQYKNIEFTEPLGYLDFLKLTSDAKLVLTDSGGIQEETTILGVPCLTLRNNTERPVTAKIGSNIIVGTDKAKIIKESLGLLNGKVVKGNIPPLWDGKAAERIVRILINEFGKS